MSISYKFEKASQVFENEAKTVFINLKQNDRYFDKALRKASLNIYLIIN